jgi:hypothetical protein
MGDNKDSTGLIILGIVLGAILAFALLSRKTETLQPTQSVQEMQPQWQPMDIPRVDDIKSQPPIQTPVQTQTDSMPTQMVTQMAYQLEKATSQLSQLENATSKLQETVYKLQNNVPQPSQPPYIILQPQTIPQPPQPPQVTVQPLPQVTVQPLPQVTVQPLPQVTVQPLPQVTVQPYQFQQDNPNTISGTIYKNDEKWEIKRGPDGRIKSLNIIRDVKKNG